MSRIVKVRGLHTPQIGNVGDNKVLRYKDAALVAVPGTMVHEYLSEISLDQMEVDYNADLFFRFMPGLLWEHLTLPDYRYGVYWDAILIVGLIPRVIMAVPNTQELQNALLLGRGIVLSSFSEYFERFTVCSWQLEYETPVVERIEIPEVKWTEHTF